jgi:hypothetical protein
MEGLMLTPKGEECLGPFVASWQTHGIQIPRNVPLEGSEEATFFTERVLGRQPAFHDALRSWLASRGMSLVDIEEEKLTIWNRLTGLPLEPQEQFALLIALRETPRELLEEWQTCLTECDRAIHARAEETKNVIKELQRKLAQHVQRPFHH